MSVTHLFSCLNLRFTCELNYYITQSDIKCNFSKLIVVLDRTLSKLAGLNRSKLIVINRSYYELTEVNKIQLVFLGERPAATFSGFSNNEF